MFWKRTQTGRRNRTPASTPGIERLESRQLMAGDVGYPLISVKAPTQVSRTSDVDFMISLDRPVAPGQTLTVQYGTRGIGAVEGKDFDSSKAVTRGAVTFWPGDTQKVVDIHTLALPATAAAKNPKPYTFALDITGASSGKIVQKTAITHIVNEAPGFQIDISFSGNVSDKTKLAAREAANRWQEVITGDLPSVIVKGVYVDDFTLVVKEEAVDGESGILAYASPTRSYGTDQYVIQKRATSNTSYGGTAVVDIDDRDNAQIKDILVHEIGHALGIGPFWSLEYINPSFKPLGLVKNLMTDEPLYVGKYALAEYQKLAPGAVGIPLESGGGKGTRAAHWSEAVFGNELMTGYISDTMPLSRISVGALKDIGYSVSFAKADPYALPVATIAAASIVGSSGQGARLATNSLTPGMTDAFGSTSMTVSSQPQAPVTTSTSATSRPATPVTPAATAAAPRTVQVVTTKVASTVSLTPSKAAGFGTYGR